MEMERQQYNYYAFISYSSADGKWAKWLQNTLENYRLPTAVRKESIDIPKRINPVFRDATDLSTGVLKDVLREELEASKYLVVVCSPASAKSMWVNEEVEHFIELGRVERIIPLVIAGEPFSTDPEKEAFPPALRNMEKELIGISVSRYGRWEAFLRVVAALLGIRYDKLAMRDRRRRRTRRMAAGIAAVVAAIGVACGVWYNMPHSKYYSAYAYQNEVPYGIYEISKQERQGLSHSYKITTQRGKVTEVACVNSMDAVTEPPVTFPTAESPQLCFYYDESGRLISVENYDRRGALISTESLTYDDSNHRIAIDYRANSDTIDAHSMASDLIYVEGTESEEKSEITRQINTYNDEGYLIKTEYMRDNLGTRASDRNGVYGKEYAYDELGQVIRITNLDNNGQVYNCKYGWATIELTYDENGRITSETTYDAEGNLARNETAVVRVEYVYDTVGNLDCSNAYDENGTLCGDQQGIAQRAFLYDEYGFYIGIAYGNANGNMTANEDGVCGQQFFYDNQGRRRGMIYLDANLEAVISPVKGYCVEYYELNESGQVVSGQFMDETYQPMINPDMGAYMFTYVWDENGQVTECRYYDTDLELTINAEGCAVWRADLDDNGNITRMEYLDENGDLLNSLEYEYDSFGNVVLQRSYDADNTLTGIGEMDYDTGNLVGVRFYDAAYQPVCGLYGTEWFEARLEYDAKGNMVRMEFFDVDGKRMLVHGNFAVAECTYDAYGNLLSRSFYDETLKPSYAPYWRVEYVYDQRNNLIHEEHIGKDAASMEIAVYAYSANDWCVGVSCYDGNGVLLSTDGELVELF